MHQRLPPEYWKIVGPHYSTIRGSRAAIFGAAGLEALGRLGDPSGGSVLEQVTYQSSVSGGSVAATYYASQKPPRETPVLTPDGAVTAAYETFFAGFTEKVSQDFEGALLWRQLLSFRWLNSSLAARSFAKVMAERLLGPITFHVGEEDLYWHTGDGGLYETQGLESLLLHVPQEAAGQGAAEQRAHDGSGHAWSLHSRRDPLQERPWTKTASKHESARWRRDTPAVV